MTLLNILISETSSNRATYIAQIYYYDPQSAGVKFIYSEKATKFGKISTLLLSYVVPVKSKWPSQNIQTLKMQSPQSATTPRRLTLV